MVDNMRPGNAGSTSLEMSREEIQAIKQASSDGLWWEWQRKGPNGWERCRMDINAELEQAYVLGESSCHGYDLDAVRTRTADLIRRVRWPPKPEMALPEPPCRLFERSSKHQRTLEELALVDIGDSIFERDARRHDGTIRRTSSAPRRKTIHNLSASALVWPPIWDAPDDRGRRTFSA
jgi:hypothetical protein